MQFAQMPQHRRLARLRHRHCTFRRTFHFADVGHQHRMMRGQRPPGLGQYHRRRQAVLGAGVGQRLHDVGGVLMQAVVDRTLAARAGAFVVHAKAAADIHVAHLTAELADFDQITGGFAHAVGDVAHVGNLRAHVEMQQFQAMQQSGCLELFHQIQQLPWRQPELGVVAARVLPLAGAQRRQPHAHTEARRHAQLARGFDHVRQFGGFLDHDVSAQAEQTANQRQTDVFAILVAVADHQRAGPRQRQHRHQLRLGTRFQTEPIATLCRQFTGHAEMLVDLDRIDRAVATAIALLGHCLRKSLLQGAEAMPENVGKPQQHGQLETIVQCAFDRFGQGNGGAVRPLRLHRDPTLRIDIEITLAPVGNGIGAAGAVEGPGHQGLR